MSGIRDRDILALLSDPDGGHLVLQCAEAIRGAWDTRIHVLRGTLYGTHGLDEKTHQGQPALRYPARKYLVHYPPRQDLVNAAESLVRTAGIGMLVADWALSPEQLQPVLRLAVALNLPAVFLRPSGQPAIGRVLLATGGGPHLLQQLWLAKQLATHFSASTFVLRVQGDALPEDERGPAGPQAADTLAQARVMGVAGPVEVCAAADVVTGIERRAQPSDLVVLGAPRHWRAAEHFAGSIPDLVAQRIPNAVAMLLGKRPNRVSLADVLWDQMICLGLTPRTRAEAIALLVGTLVKHNQVPYAWRERLLERALAGEGTLSAAVGCETAFLRIALRDVTEVSGCLGVFPGGVAFANGDEPPAKFVFLLVTPEDLCGEYLTVLAKIAQMMIRPEVRQALAASKTPSDALAALAPVTT